MTAPRSYLTPTPAAGRALMARKTTGSVVMLNLLRFRAQADYRTHPELAPAAPISGAAAFERYIQHTLPWLRASGGELLFLGAGGDFFIGPPDEHWDQVMLVRQHSLDAFLSFAEHPGYLAGIGHRDAALADARLLPLTPLAMEANLS